MLVLSGEAGPEKGGSTTSSRVGLILQPPHKTTACWRETTHCPQCWSVASWGLGWRGAFWKKEESNAISERAFHPPPGRGLGAHHSQRAIDRWMPPHSHDFRSSHSPGDRGNPDVERPWQGWWGFQVKNQGYERKCCTQPFKHQTCKADPDMPEEGIPPLHPPEQVKFLHADWFPRKRS